MVLFKISVQWLRNEDIEKRFYGFMVFYHQVRRDRRESYGFQKVRSIKGVERDTELGF